LLSGGSSCVVLRTTQEDPHMAWTWQLKLTIINPYSSLRTFITLSFPLCGQTRYKSVAVVTNLYDNSWREAFGHMRTTKQMDCETTQTRDHMYLGMRSPPSRHKSSGYPWAWPSYKLLTTRCGITNLIATSSSRSVALVTNLYTSKKHCRQTPKYEVVSTGRFITCACDGVQEETTQEQYRVLKSSWDCVVTFTYTKASIPSQQVNTCPATRYNRK